MIGGLQGVGDAKSLDLHPRQRQNAPHTPRNAAVGLGPRENAGQSGCLPLPVFS